MKFLWSVFPLFFFFLFSFINFNWFFCVEKHLISLLLLSKSFEHIFSAHKTLRIHSRSLKSKEGSSAPKKKSNNFTRFFFFKIQTSIFDQLRFMQFFCQIWLKLCTSTKRPLPLWRVYNSRKLIFDYLFSPIRERMSERNRAHEQSDQYGASKRVSKQTS